MRPARAHRAATGYASSDVLGRSCRAGVLNHVDADGHRLPVAVNAGVPRDDLGTVTGAVEVFREDSHRRDLEQRLDAAERDALVDPLTGLSNRRMLQRVLHRHHAESERYQRSFAVLFADIDNFKAINDSYGHDPGDRLLRMVATTLRTCTRPTDTVGRWGGEEFLLLAPVVNEAEAVDLADRGRRLVSSGWIEVGSAALLPRSASASRSSARVNPMIRSSSVLTSRCSKPRAEEGTRPLPVEALRGPGQAESRSRSR